MQDLLRGQTMIKYNITGENQERKKMKKTSVVRSCCLTVVSAIIIFLGIYVSIPQQAWAAAVKYPVTGGNIIFAKSTGTVVSCDETVTEAVIPEKIDGTEVKQIGQNAFSGCGGLASVTLPEGLTRIDRNAFDRTNITEISVPSTVTYADPYAFSMAKSLEAINVAEGNDTYCSKDGVMFNKEMTVLKRYPPGKACDEYAVPSGVTQIYEGAFLFSENVSDIVIPDSVEKIGIDAFRECRNLKKVELSGGMKTIPQRCFYNSTDLEGVTIPESVKTIADDAFLGNITVTIYGVAGSYAETFAESKNLNFSAIPEDGRKPQEILCADTFVKTYGDDDFDLCAYSTADSGCVKLQYESLSPDVAEVSDEGRVTIKRAGRAGIQITAPRTDEYKYASKEVDVLVDRIPRTITTDKDEYDLTYGDAAINIGLSATGEGDITCSSDKSSVAMAVIRGTDRQGLVTPVKPGTAVITYTAETSTNYHKAEKQITVRVHKAENHITSERDSFTVDIGRSFTLDLDAQTDIRYRSSNSSVASVDADGRVRTSGTGTAVITATAVENEYYNSIEKEITINVNKGIQTVNTPTFFKKTFGAAPFRIGASANTALKYRSSDKNIASVSSSGQVTLKNPGKAYITVTAVGTKDYESAYRIVEVSSFLKKPDVTLQAQKGRKVKISWNKVPGADGYRIYLYDSSKKKYTKLITKNSKVKSVLHKGLKAGKTYSYKIRVYRKVNGEVVYSSYSSVKKVRVKK